MKETYWGYWLVILGVFVIGVMLLVNNISTTSTQDYYNIKEVTQASLIDAVDFSYYRLYGNLKINEQKFVENFLRRFAENVNIGKDYTIDFYDLYEVPPKVSVKISTGSNAFNIADTANNTYDVVTTITQILELGAKGDSTTNNTTTKGQSKCLIHVTERLMKYFQGKEVSTNSNAKYSITSDRNAGRNYVNLSANDSQKVKNFSDLGAFKSWFINEYKPDGSSATKEYLLNHSYSQLSSAFKTFISRGWLVVDEVNA